MTLRQRLRELSDYLPHGPVLDANGRARWLAGCRDEVRYSGDSRVSFPIPPAQFFGLTYLQDIVLVTEHPEWTMHEYAQVQLPQGTRWICKDSNRVGQQTITSDLPDLAGWVPEVPVVRRTRPVAVVDRSAPGILDVQLRYESPLDEVVDLHLRGKLAQRRERWSNGSAFNHSQETVAVVVDISKRQPFGLDAAISFNGTPARIKRLLGLFPVKAILTQTQGGLAIASMRLQRDADRYRLTRPIAGTTWNTHADERWQLQRDGEITLATHRNQTSRFELRYVERGLQSARVWQAHDDLLLTSVELSAPLPDISRPFQGTVTRHFVVEINGLTLGCGSVDARHSDGGEVIVAWKPTAPRWFRQRPIRTQVEFQQNDDCHVVCERV